MALRVLLADESPTIKKVFQLALQDYAVDVTSVGMGLDVVPVARQFKPDIVFCDILLQKRNGYDVCAEIKNDQQLKSLPVILMWSSFMELDQDKTQAARADGNLQKPFEVQDLRAIVNQFVAKTRQQRLGNFLNFPKMPDMVEAAPENVQLAHDPTFSPAPAPGKDWNMDHFDPVPSHESMHDGDEDFQEVPLPPSPKVDEVDPDIAELESETEQERESSNNWSTKSLGRFQMDQEAQSSEMLVSMPDENDDIVLDLESDDEIDPPMVQPPAPRPQAPNARANSLTGSQPVTTNAPLTPMTEAQLEKIVREQAKSMIEAVVWKVVPDLATQIIERELKRLLAEKNS